MKKVFFMGAICLASSAIAQQMKTEQDSVNQQVVKLDEVLVSAVRAKETLPVTFSNISKKEIQKKNAGQQIPMLIGGLPNVVSYSEDGSGIGATYFSVRGSDLYRTNVTINGIPYNDAESQGTFWYNLSDFASSAESIQLQRGVGTSTNGAGAFGASLNVLTDAVSENPYAQIANFYGSYNTHKHSVKLSTGKINDRFEVAGRFSKINSDGYVERASSDLKSYFLQGAYSYGSTLLKALIFGGKEKTYLTWIGVDKDMLETNRRYNYAGAYTINGVDGFYKNETDNYQQDHAQLHWVEKWLPNWSTNLAFHYTKGRGYWENFEEGRYSKYKLPKLLDGSGKEQKAYVIVQKALDNDFYGSTFSANYKNDAIDLTFGGAGNIYEGKHFREILWAEKAFINFQNRYRDQDITKKEASSFAKLVWKVADKWSLFGDLQYRYVAYQAKDYEVDVNFGFFNPKAGVSFAPNQNSNFYLSYARASKEPNRSDYTDGDPAIKPKAEKLNDFELGWRCAYNNLKINANAYYMSYQDQLVLTGELSDTGYPIRANTDKSFRAGIEIDAFWQPHSRWIWQPSVAVSRNKIDNFSYTDNAGNVKDLGSVNISYSPEIVVGNSISFLPLQDFQISLVSKFVSEQFMLNENTQASKLSDYFVNDLHISYEIAPKKWVKNIGFSLLANNIFNRKYVARGYMYDGAAMYFPQAEINYLAGVTFSF